MLKHKHGSRQNRVSPIQSWALPRPHIISEYPGHDVLEPSIPRTTHQSCRFLLTRTKPYIDRGQVRSLYPWIADESLVNPYRSSTKPLDRILSITVRVLYRSHSNRVSSRCSDTTRLWFECPGHPPITYKAVTWSKPDRVSKVHSVLCRSCIELSLDHLVIVDRVITRSPSIMGRFITHYIDDLGSNLYSVTDQSFSIAYRVVTRPWYDRLPSILSIMVRRQYQSWIEDYPNHGSSLSLSPFDRGSSLSWSLFDRGSSFLDHCRYPDRVSYPDPMILARVL